MVYISCHTKGLASLQQIALSIGSFTYQLWLVKNPANQTALILHLWALEAMVRSKTALELKLPSLPELKGSFNSKSVLLLTLRPITLQV